MGARDRASSQRTHRKARDRSLALLLVGVAILMPPFAGVFLIDGAIAGFPVPLLYVFLVWIGLIAGTAILAPALRDGDDDAHPPDGAGTGD